MQSWCFLPGSLGPGSMLNVSCPQPQWEVWVIWNPTTSVPSYSHLLICSTLPSRAFYTKSALLPTQNSLIFSHAKVSIAQVFIVQESNAWENPTHSIKWNTDSGGKRILIKSIYSEWERLWACSYLYYQKEQKWPN